MRKIEAAVDLIWSCGRLGDPTAQRWASPSRWRPAMVAVWAFVKPQDFALYLGFTINGSIFAGYAYTAALIWLG